jgi:hypothetical protein
VDFSLHLWDLCSLLIEEDILCEAQSYRGALCCKVKVLTFQVTAHVGLLEGRRQNQIVKKLSWAYKEFSEGKKFLLFSRKQQVLWCVAKA